MGQRDRESRVVLSDNPVVLFPAAVEVKMTPTTPGCGMGPVIAEDARRKIAELPIGSFRPMVP